MTAGHASCVAWRVAACGVKFDELTSFTLHFLALPLLPTRASSGLLHVHRDQKDYYEEPRTATQPFLHTAPVLWPGAGRVDLHIIMWVHGRRFVCGRSVIPNYHVLPAEAAVLWHASRPCLTPVCSLVSLAGAATTIIFVFCRDKITLVATKLLSRQNYVCRDKHDLCLSRQIFVTTNIIFRRQSFVARSILWSRQTRVLTILVAAPATDTLEATHTFQAGMVSFQRMFPVKDRTRAVGPSCHLIHYIFAWTQICAKHEVGWGKGLGSLVFTLLVMYDTLVWQ